MKVKEKGKRKETEQAWVFSLYDQAQFSTGDQFEIRDLACRRTYTSHKKTVRIFNKRGNRMVSPNWRYGTHIRSSLYVLKNFNGLVGILENLCDYSWILI